jgi:hypothetical protein
MIIIEDMYCRKLGLVDTPLARGNLTQQKMPSKTLFIIPTDAHYYKSVEMLK